MVREVIDMLSVCRFCGKCAMQINGYLERINEKGVAGIWECRPSCQADLPQDTKLIMAIEGSDQAIDKAKGK